MLLLLVCFALLAEKEFFYRGVSTFSRISCVTWEMPLSCDEMKLRVTGIIDRGFVVAFAVPRETAPLVSNRFSWNKYGSKSSWYFIRAVFICTRRYSIFLFSKWCIPLERGNFFVQKFLNIFPWNESRKWNSSRSKMKEIVERRRRNAVVSETL